ncbi:MAG: RHS repeat protein [Acidobacteria bacterium]|nr:RHS repeat protein [Acidobacteriota bacterium]MCI0719244.1 RHS repeat protein [Acidobacteriota bacterium]
MTYQYDVAGNLRHVTLPDGTQIDYVIDAQNRCVGKNANSVLVHGFLYDNQLKPVADLDSSNHCQSWADRVRKEYERLKCEQEARRRFGKNICRPRPKPLRDLVK